jgi:hypothetical protein
MTIAVLSKLRKHPVTQNFIRMSSDYWQKCYIANGSKVLHKSTVAIKIIVKMMNQKPS